eukprot:103467-Alexandrium_andersonii.AAC.1
MFRVPQVHFGKCSLQRKASPGVPETAQAVSANPGIARRCAERKLRCTCVARAGWSTGAAQD